METTESQTASNPGAVVRDVVILWVLTLAGGFIAGIASARGDPGQRMSAVAISNILFSTLGFVLVGCLVGGRRWKHLLIVTVIVWLTGLINLFFGFGLTQWLISLPLLLILMGIGGGMSYLLRR